MATAATAVILVGDLDDNDGDSESSDTVLDTHVKRGRPADKAQFYVTESYRVDAKGKKLVNCNVKNCAYAYTFGKNDRADRIRAHLTKKHGINLEGRPQVSSNKKQRSV